MMESVAQWFHLDAVNHLTHESILEEQACLFHGDASLLHIEESLVIELSHRRAMSTLHIIRIYFQHGLGEHTSLFRSAEVLVCHLRGSLLRILSHKYETGKGSDSLVIDDIFVQLMRITVRHTMVNESIVVHVLLLVLYRTAIHIAFCPFAGEYKAGSVARHTIV